jgi:hypothetical protein
MQADAELAKAMAALATERDLADPEGEAMVLAEDLASALSHLQEEPRKRVVEHFRRALELAAQVAEARAAS